MRGRRNPQSTMLAFVNLDERVPQDHPLRIIKGVADDVVDRVFGDFDKMYSKIGRSSVQPHYRCCALRRLPSRRNLPAPNLTCKRRSLRHPLGRLQRIAFCPCTGRRPDNPLLLLKSPSMAEFANRYVMVDWVGLEPTTVELRVRRSAG